MPIRNLKSAINHPGGPGEIRTLDLLSAIEARSQLRYRPVYGRGVFYLRQGRMSRKRLDWEPAHAFCPTQNLPQAAEVKTPHLVDLAGVGLSV